MGSDLEITPEEPRLSSDLAGSTPIFAREVGGTLLSGLDLGDFGQRHLLFSQLEHPGRVHVYRADCRAGERLRVQTLAPVLGRGAVVAPAVAVVAQSLPYDGEEGKLPIALPAGYSAVVAMPPRALLSPVRDMLTRVSYFPGPVIDTQTLVGGRCYIVVWSPQNQMGKYVLHIGHRWPWSWQYWLGVPGYWWKIRGWFGKSRKAAYALVGGLVVAILLLSSILGGGRKDQDQIGPQSTD